MRMSIPMETACCCKARIISSPARSPHVSEAGVAVATEIVVADLPTGRAVEKRARSTRTPGRGLPWHAAPPCASCRGACPPSLVLWKWTCQLSSGQRLPSAAFRHYGMSFTQEAAADKGGARGHRGPRWWPAARRRPRRSQRRHRVTFSSEGISEKPRVVDPTNRNHSRI